MLIVEPITAADRARFLEIAPAILGVPSEALNIEEVDIHWQVAYATGDIGQANSALEKIITIDHTTAGNKAVQTSDPKLKGEAVNAGDQLICFFGLGATFDAESVSDISDARSILADFRKAVVHLQNGNNRRNELWGDTFVGCPLDLLSDGATVPGRGPLDGSKMRKLGAPFTIGKDQQFTMKHFIGRTAAWPAAFSVDYFAPSLIARKK